MSKERSSPVLRDIDANENSDLETSETASMKSKTKDKAVKLTSSSEKNDNNENNEIVEETTSFKKIESGVKAKQSVLAWTPANFELNKDYTSTTEKVRSDMMIEQSPVTKHKHLVRLQHKEIKELHIENSQTNKIEELKQKLSRLKGENALKKERLAKTITLKNEIIKTGKMRKLHTEELKKEIDERKAMEEELLALLNPIEEIPSIQRLKRKKDLVVELLNTLSFLNYEISELKENV